MEDRELLEAAARAVGIEGQYFESDNPVHTGIYRAGHDYYWNPLRSSSEALNLAADLGLSLHVHSFGMSASHYAGRGYLGGWMDRGIDDRENYRRCIVRAAAAIALPPPPKESKE